MLQKFDTGNAFVFRIRIREMFSDITKGSRTKQCIHDRMQQHICVRMSKQTFFPWNLNSAQNQCSVFYQFVNIVTYTNSHCHSPYF